MDIETLEHTLSELNEIERAYRDGAETYWVHSPEFLDWEDDRLRIKKSVFIEFNDGSGIGRGRKPMTHDQWIFVFRNLRFETAPEHVHDFVEIAYAYRGTCHQRVNGHEVTLSEGQVLLLDTDCPHLTHPLGADDIQISLCIDKHLLQESLDALREAADPLTGLLASTLNEQANHNRYLLIHSEKSRRIHVLFQEILCEYIEPSPNSWHILAGLFQLLLVDLLNVYETEYERDGKGSSTRKASAGPLIEYIQENYLECTLESVAERFFMSPNYVSRILKQSIGMTYQQLVQELRILHAASLICTGDYGVEEAARAVGYTNMSFFYRKFKEAFGVTPGEYRDHMAGEAAILLSMSGHRVTSKETVSPDRGWDEFRLSDSSFGIDTKDCPPGILERLHALPYSAKLQKPVPVSGSCFRPMVPPMTGRSSTSAV